MAWSTAERGGADRPLPRRAFLSLPAVTGGEARGALGALGRRLAAPAGGAAMREAGGGKGALPLPLSLPCGNGSAGAGCKELVQCPSCLGGGEVALWAGAGESGQR